MIDKLLGFLPNLLGASLILLVGWLVARIVRQIVTGLLVAVGADRLGERVGLGRVLGSQTLSGVIGTLVYALIMIPTIIASLNALQIEAISGPATAMLTTLLNGVPAIFGAAVVLGITYLIGRLVAGLVTNILTGIGFIGVIIFGLGLYLGNLARGVVLSTAGAQANLLAQVARVAIIVLSAAMALRQMGIANDIVNLAFGLLLGAIAVAVALSVGLGTRHIAAREVEGWLASLRGIQKG